MKHFLLMIVMVIVGCGKKEATESWVSNPSDPNNVKIEKAIRGYLNKLTKSDLEKVTAIGDIGRGFDLDLSSNQLTTVEGLKKLRS